MAIATAAARRFLLHRSHWFGRQSSPHFNRVIQPTMHEVSRAPPSFCRDSRSFYQRNSIGRHAAQTQDEQGNIPQNHTTEIFTVPTMLTAARVVAVPALISVFFSNQSWSPLFSTGIFVAACLTDWLDGYIARKMKSGSAFGAFLDPVADKLMVATALVLLCSRPLGAPILCDLPWLVPVPAAIMISREIVISAIREWAALQGGDLHKVVAVDKLGKVKTATQMISLTMLLAFGDAREGGEVYLASLGVGLLYASTGLSLWSLSGYMRRLWHNMKLRQKSF